MLNGIIFRSTHHNEIDLQYIINLFKIQFEINRKMTADADGRFLDMVICILS